MAILINMSKRRRLVEDENLSLKAKGLLLYLCSKGKASEFTLKQIINDHQDNRASVSSGMTALENARYLHKFGDQNFETYIVFDGPTTLPKRTMNALKKIEFPGAERVENLHRENILVYYTTIYSTIVLSKGNLFISTFLSKDKKVDVGLFRPTVPKVPRLRKDEKEINRLFEWWRKNIVKHKPGGKTYERSLKVLIRKYESLNKRSNNNHLEIRRRKPKRFEIKRRNRSKGFETIMAAFRVYGEMVNDENCFPVKKPPWVINLDQFFGFTGYFKDNVLPKFKNRGFDSIVSWYSECVLGREYCYNTWAEVSNPYLIEVLNSHFFPGRDFDKAKVSSRDYSNMVLAAREFSRFYEENKSRIQTPNKLDERYEARFAKYLFKFIDHKFTTKPFKLYYILNKRFLDQEFKEYLLEMGWMKRR